MGSGSEIEIRLMNAEDKIQWARMRLCLWPSTPIEEHLSQIEEFFGHPAFCAWVVEAGGEPVGFAEAYIRPHANGCKSRPAPFLEGVWIRPDLRRKNLGRSLVEAVIAWAREKGFFELGSDAAVDDEGAIDAHLHWGFVETQRVVYFRKAL